MSRLLFIPLLLFLIYQHSAKAESKCDLVTSAIKREMLEAINKERAKRKHENYKHLEIEEMKDLAPYVKKLADEHLFPVPDSASGYAQLTYLGKDSEEPMAAVRFWLAQEKHYNYKEPNFKQYDIWDEFGQLLWKKNEKIDCAACKSENPPETPGQPPATIKTMPENTLYVVCRVTPGASKELDEKVFTDNLKPPGDGDDNSDLDDVLELTVKIVLAVIAIGATVVLVTAVVVCVKIM